MSKSALIVLPLVLALTGCSGAQPIPSEQTHSSDWQTGYNYASQSWAQPGFRALLGANASSTSICNYITQTAITGFNPFSGFKSQKERDFYQGCKQYFSDTADD